MMLSLNIIEGIVKTISDLQIENIIKDSNPEYEGIRFLIGNATFRSRLAKRTPKKKGYFVVFWEKSVSGTNKPYGYENCPDKIIITIIDNERKGQFIFPKKLLLENGILESKHSKGKMAIRVYPSWETELNKTAHTTQRWQQPYFFEISEELNIEKVKALYF